MAIKISGTTVIDDNRDINNIGIITVTDLQLSSTNPVIKLTDTNQAVDNKSWSITAGNTQLLRIQGLNDAGGGGGNYFDFYRSGNQVNELRGAKSANTWFVVDNNNKDVGIGTDNPDTLLTLYSDAADEELLHFNMGSPENRRGWKFEQLNTDTSTGLKLKANSNSKPFEIHGSDDSLHFKVHTAAAPNGYVAIPVKVSIGDSIYHYGNASANIRFPANDTFSAETAGSERFRITSTGAICFGNTDNSASGYGESGWVLTSNADAPPTWQASSGGGGGASGLWASNATGINTSTNVGIATTTASAMLEIGSSGIATATTMINAKAWDGQTFNVDANITSDSIFAVNDISGLPVIDFNASHGLLSLAPFGGNISIGYTNAGTKLGLKGSTSERVHIVANKLSAVTNHQINIDNGNVQYFSSTEDTAITDVDITSNNTLNIDMAVGDSITVVAIIKPAATADKITGIEIDGTAVTEQWLGGSAPDGGDGGTDVYTFFILKTADATFTSLCNKVNFKEP